MGSQLVMFQRLDQLASSHQTWYERHTLAGHHNNWIT